MTSAVGAVRTNASSVRRLMPNWAWAILILIMVFKPQGLFGEETREG